MKNVRNISQSILQAYFNLRMVSYLVAHDKLDFGGRRIANLEKTVNQYIEDYDAGIYPEKFFMDQMQGKGIDVRTITHEIPSRQRMMLAYGSRIPKRISPQDLSAIRLAIQTYLAISSYALNKNMHVPLKTLKEIYFPCIFFNVECLAEKERLRIEDIVAVLADECNYMDSRYA